MRSTGDEEHQQERETFKEETQKKERSSKTERNRNSKRRNSLYVHQVTGSGQNRPKKARKMGCNSQAWPKKPQAPEWGQCYGPDSKAQIIKE
ncbi:hypothetical protein PIB30_055559 [Stylosanthes scabra]|uniref:Uncharacterized protein n=1 Tax=Stylosanthes scabra TaxID=79078 RepID=A0ABU6XI41_9FABA|nr:hypothetical protein [Stylosanthes scabra]